MFVPFVDFLFGFVVHDFSNLLWTGKLRLAVLDDEIEMHADQASQDGRQHPDVGGKKALQREGAQVRSAAQDFENEVADNGDSACDLRADRRRPVGSLVPGEQITR